jgi:predicted nucleic acid-binding protein
MRAPSSTLVVDTAILISAVLGKTAEAILLLQQTHILATTDRALQEAQRRIELGLRRPELLVLLDNLAAIITVVPVTTLAFLLPRCKAALRDAVASRNGSTRDTHILALAWSVESDIWTTDRDFAGTGVPTWSTPNLLRSLVGALQGPGSGPDL